MKKILETWRKAVEKIQEQFDGKKAVITLHEPDPKKLQKTVEEMKEMGSPNIHAVFSQSLDSWVALEGVHRLNAAQILDIPVNIIEEEYSNEKLSDFEWSDLDLEDIIEDIVDDAAARYNRGLYVIVEIV